MPWCPLGSSYCSEKSIIWGAGKNNTGGNLLFYFLCQKMTGDRNQWDFYSTLYTEQSTLYKFSCVQVPEYSVNFTLYTAHFIL